MHFDSSQHISAFCGMLLVLLVQIENEEIVKTILLAGVGGTSSYLFTIGVKFLIRCLKNKKQKL